MPSVDVAAAGFEASNTRALRRAGLSGRSVRAALRDGAPEVRGAEGSVLPARDAIAALYDSTVSYAALAADSTGVPRRMTADTVRAVWTRYLASQKRPLRITLLRAIVLGPSIAWEYRIVDDDGPKRARAAGAGGRRTASTPRSAPRPAFDLRSTRLRAQLAAT